MIDEIIYLLFNDLVGEDEKASDSFGEQECFIWLREGAILATDSVAALSVGALAMGFLAVDLCLFTDARSKDRRHVEESNFEAQLLSFTRFVEFDIRL